MIYPITLVAIVLATSLAAIPVEPPRSICHDVQCEGGRHFDIMAGEGEATVMIDGRRLDLKSRSSAFGKRFNGAETVLIIDGTFIALVLRNDLDLKNCQISQQALDEPPCQGQADGQFPAKAD